VGVTHPQLVPVLEPRSCGWRTLIESPRRSVAVRLFGLAGLSGILAVVGLAGVVAGVVARAGKAAAQVAIRGMDSGAAHGAIPAVATRPPDMALWLMALGSALLVAGLVAASRYEVERAAVRNLEREGAAWLVKAWQRSPWYRRSLDRLRLRCASVERPVGA